MCNDAMLPVDDVGSLYFRDKSRKKIKKINFGKPLASSSLWKNDMSPSLVNSFISSVHAVKCDIKTRPVYVFVPLC